MVKKSMYWKNLWKSIGKTKARFISIFAIVFLGAMVFAGLRNTPGAMMKTMDAYLDERNYAELTYISTLGFSEEDIKSVKEIEGIESVSYGFQFDALMKTEGKQAGITVYTTNKYKKGMLNEPLLVEGRYPKKEDECIIDYYMLGSHNIKLNDEISIYNDYGEKKFKVVGIVKDVRYISQTTRGTNSLGDGSNDGFIQILTKGNEYLAIPDSLYELRKEDVLYTQLCVGVKGAEKLNAFSDSFDEYIEEVNTKIKSELSLRMSNLYETYTKDTIAEYEDGIKQYEEGLKEYEEGKSLFDKQILEAKIQLTNAKIQLAEGEAQYLQGQDMAIEGIAGMVDTLKQTSEELKANLDVLQGRLDGISDEELKDTNELLNTTITSVSTLIEKCKNDGVSTQTLQYVKNTLEETKEDISNRAFIEAQAKYEISIGFVERIKADIIYEKYKDELSTILNDLEVLSERMETFNALSYPSTDEMDQLSQTLEKMEALLDSTSSLEGVSQLSAAEMQIQKAKLLIQQQENELTLQELKTTNELEKARKELESAKEQLDEAEELINDIPKGKVYTLTRHENEGLIAYDLNVGSIQTIADVFPLLFFLVSALVSLTTMTRMVEEQRSQNGTLRALGYSKWDVMQQYVVYVISATLLACLIGMVVGTETLPRIICFLYNFMMFSMVGTTQVVYSGSVLFQTVFISVFVTLFATMFVLISELNLMPAVLMRPKAPKIGKRILLERITFIWKRLSFNQKVTMRNIFRYKKRFFMSIIGIAGCTGLIVTGFGINYSVSQVITKQYENVLLYDAVSTLEDEMEILDAREMQKNLLNRDEVNNIEAVYNKSTTLLKNKETLYGYTLVYQSMDNITNFIDFNDSKTKENLILDDEGIVLTQKAAETMDVVSGDTIDIELDGEKYNVKVSSVMENYVNNYIYMSETFYEELTGESLQVNQVFMNLKSLSKSNKSSIEMYLQDHGYGNITYTETMGEDFEDQVSSLKIVVIILIVCAGALNFIVLYNLTNINIQERKSEIATIKVLGFRRNEVYDYIFRENDILSVIGSLLGMFFGFFIHKFIMGAINLEIAMFIKELQPSSYIIAIAITILFTKLINYSMRKVLNKVDMVESLKSIE